MVFENKSFPDIHKHKCSHQDFRVEFSKKLNFFFFFLIKIGGTINILANESFLYALWYD